MAEVACYAMRVRRRNLNRRVVFARGGSKTLALHADLQQGAVKPSPEFAPADICSLERR